MDIFSGIASVLSGGLTGILGSVTQGIFEYKTKKLEIELQKSKYENEIALRKIDGDIAIQAWSAKVDVEDSKAFNTSLSSEPKTYHDGALTEKQNWLMVLLDFIRGIIRPFLTLYLCVLTTAIYIQAKRLIHDNDLSVDQAYDLVNQIINTILYLSTTCVMWWFGTRNKTKQK